MLLPHQLRLRLAPRRRTESVPQRHRTARSSLRSRRGLGTNASNNLANNRRHPSSNRLRRSSLHSHRKLRPLQLLSRRLSSPPSLSSSVRSGTNNVSSTSNNSNSRRRRNRHLNLRRNPSRSLNRGSNSSVHPRKKGSSTGSNRGRCNLCNRPLSRSNRHLHRLSSRSRFNKLSNRSRLSSGEALRGSPAEEIGTSKARPRRSHLLPPCRQFNRVPRLRPLLPALPLRLHPMTPTLPMPTRPSVLRATCRPLFSCLAPARKLPPDPPVLLCRLTRPRLRTWHPRSPQPVPRRRSSRRSSLPCSARRSRNCCWARRRWFPSLRLLRLLYRRRTTKPARRLARGKSRRQAAPAAALCIRCLRVDISNSRRRLRRSGKRHHHRHRLSMRSSPSRRCSLATDRRSSSINRTHSLFRSGPAWATRRLRNSASRRPSCPRI